MNIKPGVTFKAYSIGEAIVDLDTHLVLGHDEKMIGVVEFKTYRINSQSAILNPAAAL